MNRSIRRLGVALLAAYLVLFAQLNHLQIFGAERLNEHPTNAREAARDFERRRGLITTADGVVLARTVETPEGPGPRRREYPEGAFYAHLTGYFSRTFGSTGIERTYNDELAGKTVEQRFGSLSDLFNPRDRTGNVTLTVHSAVQQAAIEALGFRRGSVVAIDPRDGAVLAFWSVPSYDPNPLSDPDTVAANAAKAELDADPTNPLLPRMYRERFFPGSTFKVVTAAAGLTSGGVGIDNPVYPRTDAYLPPLTSRPIRNFGGATCGGSLFEVMRVSCNTAFAHMAAEHIGPDPMIAAAEAFGFNHAPPIDLPAPARSLYPTDFGAHLYTLEEWLARRAGDPAPSPDEGDGAGDDATATASPGSAPVSIVEDTPRLAQTAIGQNDVMATPLQMALVAAAVANGGVIMEPFVMQEIRDSDGEVLARAEPRPWRRAVSPGVAGVLAESMLQVVSGPGGTGSRLAIPGQVVAGKTGTAQLGTEPASSHAWVIAFAGPAGEAPRVAVAVIVEGSPGDDQTGGRVAAPIARAVMEAALGVR